MILINQYKRLDVFKCNQDSHRHFDGRVSVYHVMKKKGCYPEGCIYFLWRCALLEKGHRCVSGYSYVGKFCKGCTYYVEEKVHLQPEIVMSEEAYTLFLEDLEDFETWLESIRFKTLPVAGYIKVVKPWFQKILLSREQHLRIHGYLLAMKNGFIGQDTFKDTYYIRVSKQCMKQYRFVPKMQIELIGEIREDRGRLIIHRPRRIEIIKKGWGHPWTDEKALVAVKTATLMKEQPERCLDCRWGTLVDVIDRRKRDVSRYRNLYCLKGIADYNGCYIGAYEYSQKTNPLSKMIHHKQGSS
jgi:hypothetical protein